MTMKSTNRVTATRIKRNGSHSCDHKDCGRSFDTPQGLALHQRRAHGGMGVQKGQEQTEPKTRRTPRKKQGAELRYCPCCGLDMLTLSVAMNVAAKQR